MKLEKKLGKLLIFFQVFLVISKQSKTQLKMKASDCKLYGYLVFLNIHYWENYFEGVWLQKWNKPLLLMQWFLKEAKKVELKQ